MPPAPSRRALLAGLGALAAAGRARQAAAQGEIPEADKIKKADAKYQLHPNGQQRCAICLQFMPPSTCKIVQGPVAETGWCQFFAARENAH